MLYIWGKHNFPKVPQTMLVSEIIYFVVNSLCTHICLPSHFLCHIIWGPVLAVRIESGNKFVNLIANFFGFLFFQVENIFNDSSGKLYLFS